MARGPAPRAGISRCRHCMFAPVIASMASGGTPTRRAGGNDYDTRAKLAAGRKVCSAMMIARTAMTARMMGTTVSVMMAD